jgi:hypothetical protein
MDTKVTATAPFVREPGAGSTLNVLGVTHIYKATGAETAGSFSFWEDVVPPGAGAPPHTHTREDEAFYVLSGELLVDFEGPHAPRRIGPGGSSMVHATGAMAIAMSATSRRACWSCARRAVASIRCLPNSMSLPPTACRKSGR